MSSTTPRDGDTIAAGSDEASGSSEAAGTSLIISEPLATGVLRFGLPLVIAMALQATFNLVDMAIVGQLPNGTISLGALTICDQVAMVAAIIANGVSNASVAIIARRHGEGDKRSASLYTQQSIFVTLALSAFFGLIGIVFADPMSGALGAKGEVHDLASAYMRVIVGGSFSVLILFQLTAILRAVGDSLTPMVLLIGSNVLNIILTPMMVFKAGEAPEWLQWAEELGNSMGIGGMGVEGAAWSTVISRCIAIVIGIGALMRNKQLQLYLRDLLPRKRECYRILRIAWPNCSQFGLRVGVVLFFTAIIAHNFTTPEDPAVLTAFGICVRLDTVALFTGMGWGASASTYVGQNLGARKPERARNAAWFSVLYNAILMLIVYAGYLAGGASLVAVFDDSPAVVSTAMDYLTIVGATYAFLGAAVVISQALSGAGATLSSLVLDIIVLLGLQVPCTIIALAFFDVTPNAIFWLIALGNALSAVAYGIWFFHGSWVHKQV